MADVTPEPPSLFLAALEARTVVELGLFYASQPLLRRAPRGDGHSVLVLPGLGGSDASTRRLRELLIELGYDAHGWEGGRNLGPSPRVVELLSNRLAELRTRSQRRVSLVGWSLGGIYARELSKAHPRDVRQVITLGSPFGANPNATNVGRLFGRERQTLSPEGEAFFRRIKKAPPVPSTAIYSRSDGVVAWQACREEAGPLTDNIEVVGSHLGLGHNPAVVWAVADRLSLPADEWSPFSKRHATRLGVEGFS